MKSKRNVAFRNSEEQKSFPSQMRITEEKYKCLCSFLMKGFVIVSPSFPILQMHSK